MAFLGVRSKVTELRGRYKKSHYQETRAYNLILSTQ